MSGMDYGDLPQAKTPRVSTPKLALKRFVRNGNLSADALQFITDRSARPSPPGELQIHPLEQQASDAMLVAIQGFFRLQPSTDVQARFVDAVHRCQTALGSLRFWHAMNQQLRRQKGADNRTFMTSPTQLDVLQ